MKKLYCYYYYYYYYCYYYYYYYYFIIIVVVVVVAKILVSIVVANKSPKGTNVCAMIGVKWYGGCLEVCQRPSDEEKLGAIFGDNRGIPK